MQHGRRGQRGRAGGGSARRLELTDTGFTVGAGGVLQRFYTGGFAGGRMGLPFKKKSWGLTADNSGWGTVEELNATGN